MKEIFTKILFVVGLLIFLFPFILRGISYFNQTSVIYDYKENISNHSEEELIHKKKVSNEYNEKIADEKPIINMGEETFDTTQNAPSSFDFLKTGEVIGTLIIPKINATLPMYDGLEDDNLQKGVVHLKDTSYPTGSISSHAVIAGHSGLTRAKILDDLDKIEIGDNFQVEYLNENYNYEVIEKKVVLPTESESLKIRDGETLVTLVTCTPKSINTHRLLITGKKVDFPLQKELTIKEKIINFVKTNYIYIIICIIIVIIFIAIIIKLRKNKNSKKESIETNNNE